MSICPKCGNNCSDNAEECDQCGARLSPDAQKDETDAGAEPVGPLVELATFHTVSEADMVQELLETNGITCMLHGENDPIGAMSGAEPITLFVAKGDLPSAVELYKAFFSGEKVVAEDAPQPENG